MAAGQRCGPHLLYGLDTSPVEGEEVHACPRLLCSGLSSELLSRQECIPVYKQTVRADGFLGLSKAAVKAQDRIRKAVNTRSQSWNTASPVPTATIEEF